jgi:hypothetical protein
MDDTLSKKNLAGIPVFMGLSTFITISIVKAGLKGTTARERTVFLRWKPMVSYKGIGSNKAARLSYNYTEERKWLV